MQFLNKDDLHKTISFCILTPDIPDGNGDIISEEEIIKTAHDFGANMQNKFLNIDHQNGTEIEKEKYVFVENFILPFDLNFGEKIIKKGSWYVGIKFLDDELYKSFKDGNFVGVSMEGYFLK